MFRQSAFEDAFIKAGIKTVSTTFGDKDIEEQLNDPPKMVGRSTEIRAIQKYTYNSNEKGQNKFYAKLNAMLRGDGPKDKLLMRYADDISNAIGKHPLKRDIICYRNIDINPYSEMIPGDIFVEEQFISTSVSKNGALKKKYELVIRAPKGTRAACVEKLSKFPEQRELLLDKGNAF